MSEELGVYSIGVQRLFGIIMDGEGGWGERDRGVRGQWAGLFMQFLGVGGEKGGS